MSCPDRVDLGRVTAVLVHYGPADATQVAAGALPCTLPVIVIDNGPEFGAVAQRLVDRDRLTVISLGENAGFARAANAGARLAGTELLAFVNADASPTASDLAALCEVLDRNPDVAAAGPALVSADGRVQLAGGGAEPGPLSAALHAFTAGWLSDRGMQLRPRHARAYEVDWIAGTCLVARRPAFLDVGGFDEDFPLYCEDIALGRRLRRAGWRLVVDGSIRVPHEGGGSVVPSPWLWRTRGSALGYYLRSTGSPWRSMVARAVLAGGYYGRSMLLSMSGSSRSRAAEMRAYARGVVHAQRSQLS